jgi:hypothetical protein
VKIVIKNIGSVTANMLGSKTDYYITSPTGTTFGYLDVVIPAGTIPPGGTCVEKLPFQHFPVQGNYTLSSHVDHEDVIDEVDENNNAFEVQITVDVPLIEVNRSAPTSIFEGTGCTVGLSINPVTAVNGLIVIERLPTTPWLFTASNFSTPPNLYDENNGIIKWLFMSQTTLGSTQVTYTLHIPENAAGSHGYGHTLEGEWKISGAHGWTQGVQQIGVKNLPASVSDEELLDYIDQWAAGQLSSEEILLLVEVWAGG